MKNYFLSLYESVSHYQLAVDVLHQFSIAEGCDTSTGLLLRHSGIFGKGNLLEHSKHLSSNKIGKSALFTRVCLSFSLIWRKNEFFIFDFHEKGIPDPRNT